MKTWISICAAMSALGLASAAGAQPAADVPAEGASPRQPAAAVSPAQLQALRQSLLARIAVYDAAERAMRVPTDAERAALAAPAANAAARTVQLSNGGVAVKGDAGEVSLLVVDLQADGKAVVRHAGERAAGVTSFAARPAAPAASGKEVRHAQ